MTKYATAYDLNFQCCGKSIGQPQYGVTSSGLNLANKTRLDAMAISVDPTVIPLGTKIELIFLDKNYSAYNGVYTAVDRGSSVKGNRIDIFMGDFKSQKPASETINFGTTKARVKILS